MPAKKISLSGIQSSGELHLGNYFGMMKPAVDLQNAGYESIYFIVDLHALTSLHDAERMRALRRQSVVDFLAVGLDPDKSVFFFQSDVPAHAELAWVLSCLAPMGLLERAHAYKDKTAKGISPSVGLFTYPVLMAADMLLYHGEIIPVGADQKQHVEIARDLAGKFNATFGETFPLPEPLIGKDTGIVPGTDGQKMSKSYGNTIPIFAPEAEIRKKIMAIVTDSKTPDEPKDPAGNTIFELAKLVDPATGEKIAAGFRAGGMGYGDAKKILLEAVLARFAPMRERREALLADPAEVDRIMAEGAEKARVIAARTMADVYKKIGIL